MRLRFKNDRAYTERANAMIGQPVLIFKHNAARSRSGFGDRLASKTGWFYQTNLSLVLSFCQLVLG
ncbi:hypothetical protein [Thermocoleostomius sinensis]|uniref:Uncharacterized protein n=1 Tax=Thermocoleostomius sinensis A174 TaxID=2016057 RepID=A0A9E8ZJB5_9CYAN|nr:hypothetical protein [Thermocoleostomius sinensis]WAL62774.1 hypothetical protein OXH18_12505 [Thermocoleostomius sinensis A174]